MRALPFRKMAQLVAWIVTFATLVPAAYAPTRAQDRPARILYFTHSAGYRHEVIPGCRDDLMPVTGRVREIENAGWAVLGAGRGIRSRD